MNRSFSIATLLLIIAIAAMAMASIRGAWVRMDAVDGQGVLIPVVCGAVAGGVLGFALGLWNTPWPFFAWKTWGRAFACDLGGIVLGAAVGAQVTAPIGWTTVVVAPLLIIALAAAVSIRRRRSAAHIGKAAGSANIAAEPGPISASRPIAAETIAGQGDQPVLSQDAP
jgi:hypothetical protein